MKKLILACITGGWLFCGACAHHPQPSPTTSDSLSHPDSPATSFFPVADVLESEIREVDTLPVALRKMIVAKGRTDSSFIKPAEFHALAMQFLLPEFRDGRFQKEFSETSFMDNNTGNANFTYASKDKDLSLQRVDVIAEPNGSAHRMSSVYLVRHRISGDSNIVERMLWRARKRFQIASEIRINNGPPVDQQLIVDWSSGGDNE
jgi:hypothetical protein